MLQNVRNLLSSTVTLKVWFDEDIAAHLMWLLNTVSDEHDSREPIATSENSLASLFGLDSVFYADDEEVACQLNINWLCTDFRLHDCLVVDQLIINNLSTYTSTSENNERIMALMECQAIVRHTALNLVMQLA